MKKFYVIINLFRIIPAYLLVLFSKYKGVILYDLERYSSFYNYLGFKSKILKFGYLLLLYPEFVNVVEARLHRTNIYSALLLTFKFKKMPTLYINSLDIDEGLFIHHGFSIIINAKHIGKNC